MSDLSSTPCGLLDHLQDGEELVLLMGTSLLELNDTSICRARSSGPAIGVASMLGYEHPGNKLLFIERGVALMRGLPRLLIGTIPNGERLPELEFVAARNVGDGVNRAITQHLHGHPPENNWLEPEALNVVSLVFRVKLTAAENGRVA